MKINEIRAITKMTQRQFAEHFEIPIGTLRNWEQGIANPPDYIFQMIYTSIRRDKMINVETIKFVNMLNELAELSKNGIVPFVEANEENKATKIFFDQNSHDQNGGYKVVLDSRVIDEPDTYHHDIVSYYDSGNFEYQIRAYISKDSTPYVSVNLLISGDIIIIQDGTWYFA